MWALGSLACGDVEIVDRRNEALEVNSISWRVSGATWEGLDESDVMKEDPGDESMFEVRLRNNGKRRGKPYLICTNVLCTAGYQAASIFACQMNR